MTDLKAKKEYIKTFIKDNIDKKHFKKLKVCKEKKYEDILKNTINIIDNLNEEEIEFHIMLIKHIKDNKIALVDAENFEENNLNYFIYDDDILHFVNSEY